VVAGFKVGFGSVCRWVVVVVMWGLVVGWVVVIGNMDYVSVGGLGGW